RKQSGHLYKRNGWWVLRYRTTVCEGGQLKVVQRAKQIAAIDEHHKTRASVRGLVDDVLKPLNDSRPAPHTVTTLGEFVESIYLPFVDEQKRASTARDYRNKWREYLKSRCSGLWMRDVRTCDVQRLLDDIARGHNVSRTTLRHIKAQVSAIFNYAKQQGYFD